MKFRFSLKDEPVSARRELTSIKQLENETLSEFAQRIQTLVMDGCTDANPETRDQVAAEALLRGCKEKEAAQRSMDKNPRTVQEAVKFIRRSLASQNSLFGKSYAQRQVSFEDESNKDLNNDIKK